MPREITEKYNAVNVAGLLLEVRLKPSRDGQISLMPECMANLRKPAPLSWADKTKSIIALVVPFTHTKFLNEIKIYGKAGKVLAIFLISMIFFSIRDSNP